MIFCFIVSCDHSDEVQGLDTDSFCIQFSEDKMFCAVLSSIDASPASRKCLLRPGQSLLVSSDRAHSSAHTREPVDNMR